MELLLKLLKLIVESIEESNARKKELEKAKEIGQPKEKIEFIKEKRKLSKHEEKLLELFSTAEIRDDKREWIEKQSRKILANHRIYQAIADEVKIPWHIVGLIHQMESNLNFQKHLHNGDSLRQRTVRHPAGRPVKGKPPFTFIESAIDALKYDKAHEVKHWDLAGQLLFLEKFNGPGYKNRGLNSPYLWNFTQHFKKGKFVRDGVFDKNATSAQAGVVTFLITLNEITSLANVDAENIPLKKPSKQLAKKSNWYGIAKTQIGVKEVKGNKHNEKILEYHKTSHKSGKIRKDEVPWCASFVNWCLKASDLVYTAKANARSYLTYGKKLTKPKKGCIVVFWRGKTDDGYTGHVGFYVKEDKNYIHVLGGNQNNAVNVKRYPKKKLLAYRWPTI